MSNFAQDAAQKILDQFSDATCIESANYQLCGFILAAAKVALDDPKIDNRIAALMESK